MSLSEEDAQAVLDQMKAEDEAESQKAEEHKSSIVAIDLDASADVPQPLESLGVSDLPLPTARKRAKSVSEEIAAAVVARLGDEALPILGVALASLVGKYWPRSHSRPHACKHWPPSRSLRSML